MNGDAGNVAILVAMTAATIVGMAALVIDVGAMMVERSQLQSGADAAALAIARRCAEHAVSATGGCDDLSAAAVAQEYVLANAANSFGEVEAPIARLMQSADSRAGVVRVTASSTSAPLFARLLEIDRLTAGARAVARWGPMVSGDRVFPLAVCRGVLPSPDNEVAVISDTRADAEPPDACDDAATALPLGWLTPDGEGCTRTVRTVPPDQLQISPSDEPPIGPDCEQTLNDLRNAIAGNASADERTRVLAIYDPGVGTGVHPAYSLIAFEFSALRVADFEARSAGAPDWTEPCDDSSDPSHEVQCMRGYVREWLPSDDGMLAALEDLTLPAVDDTTVLDVRLVE